MNTAYYFPWVRKGLGTYIQEKDMFGERFDGMVLNRPEIRLTAEFIAQRGNSTFPILHDKTIKFVAPTDVAGMNEKAVMKVMPGPGTSGFPVQFFPYVEFWEPDFPWRYTPASHSADRLRPWIALVCCEASAVRLKAFPNGNRYFTFTGNDGQWKDCFLKPSEQWRSAHAQGSAPDRPELARLLALRNSPELQADTEYQVLLVPAFETGRLRGLGVEEADLADIPAQLPSWEEELKAQEDRPMGLLFPVYYAWSFKAGKDEFDTMVRNLRPAYTEKNGIVLDVSKMGEGLDYDTVSHFSSRRTIEMPAATRTLGSKAPAPFPAPAGSTESILYDHIRSLLEENPVFTENVSDKENGFQVTYAGDDDPLVVPPVYGARHVMASTLDEVGWVKDLNMDIHYRAAAGLGRSVVQTHQEELMNRAWKQVNAVNALNMELYNRLLSLNTGKALQGKLPRYAEGGSGRYLAWFMQLLGSMANASNGKVSLSAILADADIPKSFASATFQKMTEEITRIVSDMDTTSVMEHLVQEQTYRKGDVVRRDAVNRGNLLADLLKERNRYRSQLSNQCPMADFFFYRFVDPNDPDTIRDVSNRDLIVMRYYPNDLLGKVFADPDFRPKQGRRMIDLPFRLLQDVVESRVPPKTYAEMVDALKLFFDRGVDQMNGFGYILDDATYDALMKDCQPDAWVWNKRIGKNDFFLLDGNGDLSFYRKGEKKRTIHANMVILPEEDFRYGNQYCFLEYDKRFFTSFETLRRWLLPNWGVSAFLSADDYLFLSSRPELSDDMVGTLLDLRNTNSAVLRMVGNPTTLFNGVESGKAQDHGAYFGGWAPEVYATLLELVLKARLWLRNHPSFIILPERVLKTTGPSGQEQVTYTWQPGHAVGALLDVSRNREWESAYQRMKRSIEEIKVGTGTGEQDAPKPGSGKEEASAYALQEALDNNEAYEQMRRVAERFYQEFFADNEEGAQLRMRYIDELLLSKYPILAYPIFPEPTSYYLKMASEKFIVPGIDLLPEDSVSMFESNAAFVEAFLCGMNTEMGQELMWREYPTDRRGSYFRKFWDSESTVSAIHSNQFFDIEPVHAWTQPLGGNHLASKSDLLIFTIKGKLMRTYPSTRIYLQRAVADKAARTLGFDRSATEKNGGIIRPVMETYLREDTFMVGFKTDVKTVLGNPAKDNFGFFLAFEEDVEDLNFQLSSLEGAADAALTADRLKNEPTVYGKHVSLFIK